LIGTGGVGQTQAQALLTGITFERLAFALAGVKLECQGLAQIGQLGAIAPFDAGRLQLSVVLTRLLQLAQDPVGLFKHGPVDLAQRHPARSAHGQPLGIDRKPDGAAPAPPKGIGHMDTGEHQFARGLRMAIGGRLERLGEAERGLGLQGARHGLGHRLLSGQRLSRCASLAPQIGRCKVGRYGPRRPGTARLARGRPGRGWLRLRGE